MGFFGKIFGTALSDEEVERRLAEVERLAALPYFLPATERLKLLTEQASAETLGPGARLHDRFIRLNHRLIANAAQTGIKQTMAITPAWQALPNVVMTTCDFESGSVGLTGDALVRSCLGKEFIVFANANPNVRERDPDRQMRLFFELFDDPRNMMFVLVFAGSILVRCSVITRHPQITKSPDFQSMFPQLGIAAQSEGKVRKFT